MAWNEPGGNGKDPWGNRRKDGPPDLDEVFKNLQNKLSGLFGSGGSGGKGNGSGLQIGSGLIALIILIIWGLYGIYIVDEGERGVVLQFGKHVDTTEPGPHWYPPVIQSKEIVRVTQVRQLVGSAQILTGDENIVQINYTIQYTVKSASDYLFNVTNPDETTSQAGESAFREIVGKNTLDYIITESRKEVPIYVRSLLQENLDLYGTGIDVNRVTLNKAQPPQEVQDAFNDAIKAREDKVGFINEANAYRNDIIPNARGEARKLIEEAKAYKVSMTKSAEGDADRFLKLLTEYSRAPKITRERLYIEAMESVFSNSGKVLVDVKGGNNMMYLPLDKIINDRQRVYIDDIKSSQGDSRNSQSSSLNRNKNSGGSRTREQR